MASCCGLDWLPIQLRPDLHFVTSVENPLGTGYAEASWVVQDGIPGAEPI